MTTVPALEPPAVESLTTVRLVEPEPVCRSIDKLAHWTTNEKGERVIDTAKYKSFVYWSAHQFVIGNLGAIYNKEEILDEAAGESFLAMVIALPHYDPTKNIMFSTYLAKCIYFHLLKWYTTSCREKRRPGTHVYSFTVLDPSRTVARSFYDLVFWKQDDPSQPVNQILGSKTIAIEDRDLAFKEDRQAAAIVLVKLGKLNYLYPRILWMRLKGNTRKVIAKRFGLTLSQYHKMYRKAIHLLRTLGEDYEK